jgi:hypothetical protein
MGGAASDDEPGARGAGTAGTFDRVVHLLVVATGVLAWLVAGLLVLLALTLEPRDGVESGASLFKAADAIGWIVIGGFVLRDAWARRRRTLALGFVAWAWVVALTWLVGQTALAAIVG